MGLLNVLHCTCGSRVWRRPLVLFYRWTDHLSFMQYPSIIKYKQRRQLVASLKTISTITSLNCVGPALTEGKKKREKNKEILWYSDYRLRDFLGKNRGKMCFFFGERRKEIEEKGLRKKKTASFALLRK